MIIKKKSLKEILFIDIETVSESPDFANMREEMKPLWARKAKRVSSFDPDDDDFLGKSYEEKAGIYSEFAKIVCITVGYITGKINKQVGLRIKTFSGDDEMSILKDFCRMLERHYDNPDKNFLCGHNIKEFDVPFICRRLVIHGMDLPRMLNISGKKPWQVGHLLDTMELWRFGDYKNYTSLALLAAALKIKSPKDDIDGSEVGGVYWKDRDIDRIVHYCEKDVATVAQIAMRFASAPAIAEKNIEYLRED